jgi:tetratricopeptide (TPR) repeat protein
MTRASLGVLAALFPAACLLGCSGASSLEEAQSAYETGDYDRAIERSTASIDGGMPAGYLVRGKSYEKKGEPLRALADYDQAQHYAPDQGEPALRQARCYLAAGRPSDAESAISGTIKDKMSRWSLRDQMLAHAVHGEVQLAVGDLPRATESFGEALKVARVSRPLEAEPATAIVHYNLSRVNFEQGAYRRARECFQSYLEIQKGAGGGPEEQDLYTLAVLHFLCEDIVGSRKVAASLGSESRSRLDAILAGDTFSVGALYDFKQKQNKDATKDLDQ